MFSFDKDQDTVTITDDFGGSVIMSFNQWTRLRDEDSYAAVYEALVPKEEYPDLYDDSKWEKAPVAWINPAKVKTVASSMLSFEVVENGVILADKFGNSTTFSKSQLLQVANFINDLDEKFRIEGKSAFTLDSEDPVTIKTTSREVDHVISQYFIISRQGDYGDTVIGQAAFTYKGEDRLGFSREDWEEFVREADLYSNIVKK